MIEHPDLPSLTHPIDIDQLPDTGHSCLMVLADEDRAALAAFLAIPGVDHLRGAVTAKGDRSLLTVEGRIEGTMIRQCVASLEEMEEEIAEDFLVTFSDRPAPSDLPEEAEADLDGPEALEGPSLDLGAVLLEQLVLSLSPHPRKDDAELPRDPGGDEKITPFAVLEQLRGSS
ncbi:hypothetical protein PB2503_08249 [Parvularcula bermudensis HTCC2503]|uniref:DUF177 domain-containing protein n=1 Tax=Parvularcula bermudensis (strain ATCC BAA-594 / HTCC2503 / KCTC 12087) TaxID=314260 RepID=E0TIC1_PARBH|nr:YceD family protein [Parvularcula bermudensis]ADM09705.1 hypothetical protein PB2503_08249 [Parvularcula bermudensis HTCC2503]